MSRLLEPCPSFIGLEIDDPAFPDELDDALARALAYPGMPSKIARSALFAQGEFGLDSFVAALFEQIHQEGHRRSVEEWWAFPPGEQVRRPAPLPLAS